jgi:hypothetical protein
MINGGRRARVSVWEEMEQREGNEARVSSRVFILLGNAPRHAADRGEVNSSEEKVATTSCSRAPVRGRG